jgi:pSer/pThr/pTyr-binding forkhead associated (FHA) protein
VAIVAGPQAGQTFAAALPCTVGRKDCDILLAGDGLISRRHARFSLVEGQVAIEDLGSTNGTQVNGAEIQQALLTPNDLVTLGETSLKILA